MTTQQEALRLAREALVTASDSRGWLKVREEALAALAAVKEPEPVVLPFSITDQEMKDLLRFYECACDSEGYDVPKERMKRLTQIGLLRRVTAGIYETTVFGLAVIDGELSVPPISEVK